MRKILSFLLVSVFLLMPVSAAFSSGNDVEYVQKSNFWTWAAGEPGTGWNKFIGYTFGVACPNSDDGYHHASSYERPIGNWTVETGYYKCICDLCGAEFKAYEKDLQQSYDNQVSELPAPTYNSDGSLLWSPRHDYTYFNGSWGAKTYCEHYGESFTPGNGVIFEDGNHVLIVPYSGNSTFELDRIYFYFKDIAPVSGIYECLVLPAFSLTASQSDSQSVFAKDWTSQTTSYQSGDSISPNCYYSKGTTNFTTLDGYYYAPTYKITPLDSLLSSTTYNINSRPTSITGDYGIIGDNGQITKVNSSTIVNEDNSTVYNPVTGETHIMSDWSYNYVDRSYTVTTTTGDTITITYGDENITILEGDITYNVYYIIEGSGETPDPGPGTNPDPDTCNHHWTETSSTPPACTVPGSRLLTCSLCGEPKTETIPATGHDWVVKQSVTTEYDDAGNLIQEGYTIWECTICGEQYKTTDGGAPPSSGSGFGESSGVFSGIFGLLLDFLSFFWNTFREFVGEGVKGFLTALMDGTSAIFGLLNPFNWGD